MWRAEIDGRTLRFHLTGINNQNFLMQDEQTGSWWQQVTGEALFGPLKGRTLDLVHHDEISFGLWKREQPGGRVLRPDDGAPWREFSHDWEAETAKLPVVTPERPGDPFDPRELVAGIALPGASKAYSVARLRRESPVLDTLAGVPLLLVVGEDGRSLRVFDRRIDGRTFEGSQDMTAFADLEPGEASAGVEGEARAGEAEVEVALDAGVGKLVADAGGEVEVQEASAVPVADQERAARPHLSSAAQRPA